MELPAEQKARRVGQAIGNVNNNPELLIPTG
jgi:hypothetical protein